MGAGCDTDGMYSGPVKHTGELGQSILVVHAVLTIQENDVQDDILRRHAVD